MTGKIETENWKIILTKRDNEVNSPQFINAVFKLKEGIRVKEEITEEEFNRLKDDLKDLGKWRRYRELKKDLENQNE